MSFLKYIKDKRYFITFYLIIMIFISLIILVSVEPKDVWNNLAYINISSFLFASIYIVIGYYYRMNFYKNLEELMNSSQEDVVTLLPESQNFEQKMFLDLFKKMVNNHNNQLQSLYEQKREQEEFIISWVHEIKLPITSSRLLIENYEGKTADYIVDKFEGELDKIEDYVEQALYYSRIDSFSKDYFITDININQIIKNSVKKYSKIFINKQISFHMDNNHVLLVLSDKKWIGFIIDQVLANSLKYTDKGGDISIDFKEDPKEKRLIIQDNGIGIVTEDINRVFERGFTGTTGRSHAKSTGMGLYLAKEMANKLGHDLSIESIEDEFTKVTIHFHKISNYHDM